VKKFRFVFVILAGAALLSLGLTACSSIPKLDISTLDPSQPVEVNGIYLHVWINTSLFPDSTAFFKKYGGGLKSDSSQLQPADEATLLQILCGTVSAEWESICAVVKADTGLTLNGDQFMADLESGSAHRIVIQKETALGTTRYAYSWNRMDPTSPAALIGMTYDDAGTIIPGVVQIQTAEWDELGTVGNIRDYSIRLPR
jgi:hypothetical protein